MAEPIGFHITLRIEGDRNIAYDTASRRAFARIVLRVARPFALLAFHWVDTHGHLEVMGSRKQAGELARRVQIALQLGLVPGARFQRAYFKPMYDIAHVRSVFAYVLGQAKHHGLDIDPLHEASNFLDLIGARTIGAWTAAHVRRFLPRVRREHVLEMVGMIDPEKGPPGPVHGLPDAAAAAVGAATLEGRSAAVVAARIAAIAVAGDAAADKLRLPQRTLHRLRGRRADPAIVRAIHQQLAIRSGA
jgi:hypothetical protein